MTPLFRTAYVYVRENFAGLLQETDSGYTFAYDADYLRSAGASAVSLTFPCRKMPMSPMSSSPFLMA